MTCERCKILLELNEALESLLVSYRLGRNPSDKLLDKIGKLKAKLNKTVASSAESG